jgi:hydroxymethylbilane synthase
MIPSLRIGTRGSPLALVQARMVRRALESAFPGIACETVEIRTQGDVDRTTPLSEAKGIGLFVCELESALTAGEVDVAVHSLKDLPTTLGEDLLLGGVLPRGDRRDAVVTRDGTPLAGLTPGSAVATGSLRRQAQIRKLRPDLRVVPVRGNVDTRLRKLNQGSFDALVVGAAALERLASFEGVAEFLDPESFIPAPGQGTIALEVGSGNPAARQAVRAVNHGPTLEESLAERAFLRRLGSGCSLPAGATARVSHEGLQLFGFIGQPDGGRVVHREVTADASEPEAAGEALAEALLEAGGAELLEPFRKGS